MIFTKLLLNQERMIIDKNIFMTLLNNLVLIQVFKTIIVKSSHQRCSMKKGVLKNCTKLTGKHLCQSFFFNKAAGCSVFL